MSVDVTASDTITPEVLPWQLETVKQLVQLKQNQRLPHAILIQMSTRMDSRNFGWYLVTALLCEDSDQPGVPCGSCQSCSLMDANNYPDFTFTTLEENDKTHKLNKDIKIDQIRRLIHQLSLTSNLKGGKLALIYPAEKMNQSAANSLLKTLEEPADQATLILITHNAGKLPITIRSRCQNMLVGNPSADDAEDWLKQQGVTVEQVKQYLLIAQRDAQQALKLSNQEFIKDLDQFRSRMQEYLGNQLDVTSLLGSMKNMDPSTFRLLVRNLLSETIHACLKQPLDDSTKHQIIKLIDLTKHSNFILQTEENNLNFQLQLEDVLISFKQILNRVNNNASTKSGYLVT